MSIISKRKFILQPVCVYFCELFAIVNSFSNLYALTALSISQTKTIAAACQNYTIPEDVIKIIQTYATEPCLPFMNEMNISPSVQQMLLQNLQSRFSLPITKTLLQISLHLDSDHLLAMRDLDETMTLLKQKIIKWCPPSALIHENSTHFGRIQSMAGEKYKGVEAITIVNLDTDVKCLIFVFDDVICQCVACAFL